MAPRGRPGVHALTVIGPSGLETVKRPDPPGDLTKDQATEWRDIVNRLPADWFPRETHPMLAQLCRHICVARFIARQIDAMQEGKIEFDLRAFDKLVGMQGVETQRITSISTKLRISQQATVKDAKAAKPSAARPPWQKA